MMMMIIMQIFERLDLLQQRL